MMINYLNKIINGDCIDVMKQLPDESVDIVITSPPYNLLNSTGNGMKSKSSRWKNSALVDGYDNHNDNMPHEEYVQWQRNCLTEMYRLIKPTGAIFYNHKWRVQGGLLQDRSDIVKDFPVRQIIIWKRSGGFNFNMGYFVPTYEVIYFIPKPKFKLRKGANGLGDVWEFKQESNNPHPAPFPEELPRRIISSIDGDVILDPFSGSGTTPMIAKVLGRNYIGIDNSNKYCEMARTRIDKRNVEPTQELF